MVPTKYSSLLVAFLAVGGDTHRLRSRAPLNPCLRCQRRRWRRQRTPRLAILGLRLRPLLQPQALRPEVDVSGAAPAAAPETTGAIPATAPTAMGSLDAPTDRTAHPKGVCEVRGRGEVA